MNNKGLYKATPEVIDGQVKTYFFNEGYINKNNRNTKFEDIMSQFIKEHPKIINDQRTNIAKQAYDNGRRKVF